MNKIEHYILRCENHHSKLSSRISELLSTNNLVDCTLAAEGKFLKAHRVILSVSSPYFAVSYEYFYSYNN